MSTPVASPPGSSVPTTPDWAWRAPELGPAREVPTAAGAVRVHERGEGPPVVFVHGLLVNANLYRGVIDRLASGHRCIAIDMPFGSHVLPVRADADVSPSGMAQIVIDVLDALELEDVTLVGNDSGGAVSQIVVTTRPERIGRLVLTSCDAFEVFPPRLFKPLIRVGRHPSVLLALGHLLRAKFQQRSPLAYGWLARRPIATEAMTTYLGPVRALPDARRDLARILRAFWGKDLVETSSRLREFDRPAMLAWSRDDRFFKPELAERLAEVLPQGEIEWIEDSYCFSPEDQPGRVAQAIAGFVAR